MHYAQAKRLPQWIIVSALSLWLLSLPSQPSQAQTNPTPAACGLPTAGVIRATVTYTLTANCTQTGILNVADNLVREISITINGNGHTITAGGSGSYTMLRGSLNGSVILNQVTIDGNNVARPAMIYANDTFNATNVTFRGGFRGVTLQVRQNTSATLNNVLFENGTSLLYNAAGNGLALNVNTGGSVTMTNALVRNHRFHSGAIVLKGNASLTTAGCLTFSGNIPYNVRRLDTSTWTDSSTGRCSSGTIGNGANAVLTPPALLSCGLPAPGFLDDNRRYTLTSDCIFGATGRNVDLWGISEGVQIHIEGNGYRLVGGSGNNYSFIDAAHLSGLTLNNLRVEKIRISNWGTLTVTNSRFANTASRTFTELGNASFRNTIFENNSSTFTTSSATVLRAYSLYGGGHATIRDSVFRNNIGNNGAPVLNTTGTAATITLEGCITFEGNQPLNYPTAANVTDNSTGPCESTVGPGPPGVNPNSRSPTTQRAGFPHHCLRLGAIGLICRSEGKPEPTVEIWQVNPDSSGLLLMQVRQSQIDAVQPYGLVASTADGRVAVRVWHDRNITIAMGPNFEGKVHHVTLLRDLHGAVIETVDTFTGLPGIRRGAETPPAPATPQALAPFVRRQAAAADGTVTHVVQTGDTIHAIALAYGISPQVILEHNPLTQGGNWIYPGQELFIPVTFATATRVPPQPTPSEAVAESSSADLPKPVYAGDEADDDLPQPVYAGDETGEDEP
ncbi:MAG: LysM peptidoglycan-binding domain-containing protein [Chloroflexi bacterium]|nr:LysM peptidoglycan-binding domain-containing protein [Chloroflexota bacterium]